MKRIPERMLDCGVLLRLYTMFISGLYCYTALHTAGTQVWIIAHANNTAWSCMVALGVFVFLGTVDVLWNDILPERFVIQRALHDRHLVSMGIAVCFAVQMWTCVKYDLPDAPLPFYAVYVVLVPASAFADVRKRFKPQPAC